jgi:hypothetical protein
MVAHHGFWFFLFLGRSLSFVEQLYQYLKLVLLSAAKRTRTPEAQFERGAIRARRDSGRTAK